MITNPWDAPFEPGCYLIHFEEKVGHAGHYTGSADCIADRIDDHEHTICMPPEEGETKWTRKGPGAKIMGVANFRKVDYTLARTWVLRPEDMRRFEKSLKGHRNYAKLCPICSGPQAYGRMP